jgi:hypothetical protein
LQNNIKNRKKFKLPTSNPRPQQSEQILYHCSISATSFRRKFLVYKLFFFYQSITSRQLCCPFIYILLTAYNKTGVGATFAHPISQEEVCVKVAKFVDDTSQFLNVAGIQSHPHSDNMNDNVNNFIQEASRNTQLWTNYLWVSGGCLNLNKCYHYVFLNKLDYKTNKTVYLDLHPIGHNKL